MAAKVQTPEQQRRRRISHLIKVGLKLVLLGMVFLFALDNAKPFAVAIGVLLELGAVWCFVMAYRLAYPKPPTPAQPYAALQESMQQVRESESPAPGNQPARSPLTPR